MNVCRLVHLLFTPTPQAASYVPESVKTQGAKAYDYSAQTCTSLYDTTLTKSAPLREKVCRLRFLEMRYGKRCRS